MRMKFVAASLLALGMAGSAFAQSNPAPTNQTIDKNQADTGGGAGTGANSTKMKMKKVDPSVTNSTTKNFNKENCKSVSGKNSLQTQGGNSNTENTCADNNN